LSAVQTGAARNGSPYIEQPRSEIWRVVTDRRGKRDYAMRRSLLLADVVGATLALALALPIVAGGASYWTHLGIGVLTLPLWGAMFKLYGLYERDTKRISHTTLDDVPWLFHAVLLGAGTTWLLYAMLPDEKLTYAAMLVLVPGAIALILLTRMLARKLVSQWLGPERVVLIGEGASAEALLDKIRARPRYGLDLIGVIARPGELAQGGTGLPVLGTWPDLIDIVATTRAERIIISRRPTVDGEFNELLRDCTRLSLKVSILPDVWDVMGPSVEIDSIAGLTVLGLNPPILSRSSRIVKRAMDIIGATAVLMLTSPLILLALLATYLDSGRPLLFRQRRVGQQGRVFTLVKIRTMVPNAEQLRDDLVADSQDGSWLKLDYDPRVTRVGRILRNTSLDELPQLWNVLRGEMSLVGPRPLPLSEDANVLGWGRGRLDLTPGITGVWQVLGRTNIGFDEMIKLDYLYVTNWSLWTDIRLICRTLPAVLSRDGVN
jgi:exopolysaccharide biosynthesis polyprenyl glycosylphosphotransferase